MKYLLDFDRTVFDMEGLYVAIQEKNPESTLGSIDSLYGIDLESLLFPDAIEFFDTHDSTEIEIVSSGFGLTGQWDIEYQTKKIELSGVIKYVNTIHVVADSKISTIKRLSRESEDVMYVDDHPEHIANALLHIPGIRVVYIDRTGSEQAVDGAARVTRLPELGDII